MDKKTEVKKKSWKRFPVE